MARKRKLKGGGEVADGIYTGTATLGKISAVIGLIVGIVIGSLLIVAGVALNSIAGKENNNKKQITVKSFTCDSGTVNDSTMCTATGTVVGSSSDSVVTATCEKEFCPSNLFLHQGCGKDKNNPCPKSVTVYGDGDGKYRLSTTPRGIGWVPIVIGIFVLIFAVVGTILTFTFKPYAAFEGGSMVLGSVFGGR
jgi:hypothetical protein